MHKIKTTGNGFYPITLADGVERRLHYTYYSLLWLEEQFGVPIDKWETDLPDAISRAKEAALLVAAGLLEDGFEDWRDVAKLLPVNIEEMQAISQAATQALEAVQSKKKPEAKKAAGGSSG